MITYGIEHEPTMRWIYHRDHIVVVKGLEKQIKDLLSEVIKLREVFNDECSEG